MEFSLVFSSAYKSRLYPIALYRDIFITYANLKLRKYRLGTRDRNLPARLLLRVRDLSVINDECISRGALTNSPAELLGEFGSDVVEEELIDISVSIRSLKRMRK